jgi:hypothetical protein
MTIMTNAEPITTRKLKDRARRAVTLSTKITSRELELISAAFEADGRALGEGVREPILKAAHSFIHRCRSGSSRDRNCRFITPFVRGLAGRLW